MKIEDTDKTTPERLPDDATLEQTLEKYGKIVDKLAEENIYLVEAAGQPTLEDKNCGFRLQHNVITWAVYKVDEVVAMIVDARNDYIERKKG